MPTDRQTDRQAGRHTYIRKDAGGHTNIQTYKDTYRQTGIQNIHTDRPRETGRHTYSEAYIQTNIHTNRQNHIYTHT